MADCAAAKFFVMQSPSKQGLGSVIHVLSFGLKTAHDYGRILAWKDPALGGDFVDPTCKPDGVRSLDCIFEPLTSCPRRFMNAENTHEISAWRSPSDFPSEVGGLPVFYSAALDFHLSVTLTEQAKKVWWRAQTTAYVARLRPAALEWVTAERLRPETHHVLHGNSDSPTPPFPLPHGTVSIHVRHGDKAKEMTLKPLSDYVSAAEKLVNQNPMGFAKMAFISSEDPTVFEEAGEITFLHKGPTSNENWTFFVNYLL